jgi:hypothetical protein
MADPVDPSASLRRQDALWSRLRDLLCERRWGYPQAAETLLRELVPVLKHDGWLPALRRLRSNTLAGRRAAEVLLKLADGMPAPEAAALLELYEEQGHCHVRNYYNNQLYDELVAEDLAPAVPPGASALPDQPANIHDKHDRTDAKIVRTNPGPLRLALNAAEHTASRKGSEGTADFGAGEKPWKLFRVLCDNYPNRITPQALLNGVWGVGLGGFDNLQVVVSAVRRALRPLGLDVGNKRSLGYKLQEATAKRPRAGAKRPKTKGKRTRRISGK